MKTLSQIQKALNVPKAHHNKFGGYNYRNCEDILEALKPLLDEDDKFSLTDEIILVGDRFYIKATASFNAHSTSGFAREALTKKGMDESQITGTASSYARKYALNGLFCIDDAKDMDKRNKHKPEEEEGRPTFNNGKSPYDLGFKSAADFKRQYADKTDKLNKLEKFTPEIEAKIAEFQEIVSAYDPTYGESFRDLVERNKARVGYGAAA